MPGNNDESHLDKKDQAGAGQPAEQRLEKQIREDQVQNAVTFLSHPKVRSSPSSSKRAFLQQKGLTAEEIDEAFRRVPEVPGTPASPSKAVVSSPPPQPAPGGVQPSPPQPEPIRWSQIILATGLFAASAYTVKSLVWPYLSDAWTSWTRHRKSRSGEEGMGGNGASEEEANTKAEVATAVAEAIRAQTMELSSSIEALKELVNSLQQNSESASAEEKITAAELRQELHSIAASLGEIAGPLARPPTTGLEVSPLKVESELSEIKALLSEYLKTPRPENQGSREEVTLEQASGPSELEPFAEAIDHQQPSNGNVDRLQKESQHVPASYMDVLAILERGETPPGIRTDINDKPPNPEQPPPPARLKARPKPWEKKVSDESIMMRSQDQQQEAQVLDTLVTEEQHQESEFVIAKPSQSIFEAATSPSRPSPSVILERLASPTRVINNSQTDGSSTTPNRITRRPLPIDINFDSESKSVEKGGEKSSTSIGSTQGSGLGRPSSRGWKPPPIPMPTLPLPVSEKTSLKSNEVDEEALSLE